MGKPLIARSAYRSPQGFGYNPRSGFIHVYLDSARQRGERFPAQQDFICLVMIENVHAGAHMPDTEEMSGQNVSAIRLLEDIYSRGCYAGLFRTGLSALELHWHISALSYFNVSNRATVSKIFGGELFEAKGQARLKRHAGDSAVRFVLKSDRLTEFEGHSHD